MVKKKRLIIIIILLLIIFPAAYVGISAYLHNVEVQTFYDGIKEISDIENSSDAEGDLLRNQSAPSNSDLKEVLIKTINTTSTEILMLQDLKTKVSNKSYTEFIDIQINRLNSENRTYTAMLDNSNTYEQYKNGQIGGSKTLSLIQDKNKEINSYANKTANYKIDADSFLSVHTDMKEKFNQLGIDEDFMYNQIENVKSKSVY